MKLSGRIQALRSLRQREAARALPSDDQRGDAGGLGDRRRVGLDEVAEHRAEAEADDSAVANNQPMPSVPWRRAPTKFCGDQHPEADEGTG